MKEYSTTELLRTAISKPSLFDELPKESFNEYEKYLIDTFKQQLKVTDKPTLKSVVRHIQSNEERIDVTTNITNLAKDIANTETLDHAEWDLAMNECLIDARNNIFRQIFSLIQDQADQKNIQQLERRLVKLNDIQNSNRYKRPLSVTDYDKLQEYEVEELKSSINWLNKHGVKFRKKDLYALIATTNGGKTVIATWMALQLSKEGHNILYLAQEESRTDTLRRVYQATLGLTKHQYQQLTAEQLQYRFDQYIQIEGFGRFDVVEWPGISVSRLTQEVDDIEEDLDFKYDAVFVDYSRHVSTTRKSNANWEAIGKVFEELKTWAMLTNKVVFTAIQLNKDSSKKFVNREQNQAPPLMDVTDVSGAYESTHWCQYIWGLNFDPATDTKSAEEAQPNDTKGTFRFQVVKQKHGDLGFGDVQYYSFLESMDLREIDLSFNALSNTPDAPDGHELIEGFPSA